MRKQIRNNVFETNSSSVHSLVYAERSLEPSELVINDDREIYIALGNFDQTYHIYKDQYNKLSYLLTCVYYLADCEVENIYNHFYFEIIQKAICSYTGAKALKIQGLEGYIDHQSVPDWDIEIIDAYDEDEIRNFVFNKNIWLKTDCD